jgi:hypothetical protein
MSCPKFTKVYLTRNGTASTTSFSFPKDGGKSCLGRPVVIWGRFFTPWRNRRGCRIIEGHVMPDHVHMCLEIPPKHPVASVIGFLKGKSSIAIARQLCAKERNLTVEHFLGSGYRTTIRSRFNSKRERGASAQQMKCLARWLHKSMSEPWRSKL